MKIPENIRNLIRKISREQILCLAAAVVLAFASYMTASDAGLIGADNSIKRSDPGGTDKQYELNVQGIGDRTESIEVKVSAREFTEEEAAMRMAELIEELALYITGENEGLDCVKYDLTLKKTISGYEGIRLSWYPEDPGLISYEGVVDNLELTEPKQTSIRVSMKAGQHREEYALPVTVYPAEMKTAEDELKKLSSAILNADSNDLSGERMVLPSEIDGISLSYGVPPNNGWITILAVGIFAALLLGLKPEQDRRNELKKRETELLLDYSDMVSKLVIYMGAGMTAGNAWVRISDNYEDSVKAGKAEQRIVYEEMTRTSRELKKGVPESKAFADFAGRCSINCYLKLVSLLEQNRKTGDARSESALLMEAQESFEQRKNTARRLGEEAGTKLMLPLIISLITVMIIVAVPAMMTLA
ncbi:MAG: hypothetical protein Q4E57_05475 [Eubacteriales bacterium]|nr:hypothetical protein [Eubacteriales bacterium]